MIRAFLLLSVLQCPDGAPPPCRGAAPAPARAAPVAPDTNRIVILPFRVTTADTLLGEGLAELLANEFTERPRAVHMGSVLRAWRRAGGGLREPLAQPDEARLAAGLGAGVFIDGSVVGLGSTRLTLSASVISVADGSVRRITPVTGPADSIGQLVERTAAELLAAAGTRRSGPSQRLTDSPAAMRAYLEGMAMFRRGDFPAAARTFETAFAADSLFGRAAFMRWLAGGWGVDFGATSQAALWRGRAQSLKDRLSGSDQIVVEAFGGNVAVRERAVQALPESPELWYFLGDSKFHGARSRGWTRSMAEARAAFERSLALDSQTTCLVHLLDIGLMTQDTALLRAAWPAFEHQAGASNFAQGLGLAVSWRLGDTRAIDAARHRMSSGVVDSVLPYLAALNYTQVGFPAALLDEILARSRPLLPSPQVLDRPQFLALVLQGRPSAAMRAVGGRTLIDSTDIVGYNSDMWLMMAAALHDLDRAVGDSARARVLAMRTGDSVSLRRKQCALRLWDALVLDSIVIEPGATGRSCQIGLQMLRDARTGPVDSVSFARQDSLMGVNNTLWQYMPIGPLVRARAWERAGYPGRALASSRTGSTGFLDFFFALRRREEGRLAAMTGDTAGAIVAYRQYLELRRDAEPWYQPQRDSVLAELNRLLPRGRVTP